MESTESRYAHLLQPIRELTKNWEIDVASELNDYLEELDEMCITFDGGKTRLNFAEAALLIQGSACIYSRKVELLHSLVYQTLEYINDKNKKGNKHTASQEDDAGGAASSNDAHDVAMFSPLEVETSENSQKSDCDTTVSVAPLPPESLIPPETHEKQKLPLISVKGEILCSQKDFRMNLFIPGEDGLILLTLRSATSRFQQDHQLPADLQHQEDDVAVSDAPADAAVDGAGDEAPPADNFLPIEEDHMELDPEKHINRQRGSAPSEGVMIRERRQLDANKQRREDEIRPAVNIWAVHEPYAVLKEDKPLKSGKCYRVPDGLDDRGKRKRKRAAPLQDFRSWFRRTSEPAEHKLKRGPTVTDLNYIYLSTLKDKVKKIDIRAGVVVSDEELRRTLLQPVEAEPQQGEEPVDGMGHPDLLGGYGEDSDMEHDALPDDIPAEFDGGRDMSPETELSYEDLVKLRVEQLVVSSQGYTQETALSRRVKDWEEMIRPELLQQEDRPAFDIHDYGDRIIGSLNGVGVRRSFSSIVHGLDNFEACKYLLASLQLANDYTVEIDSATGLEDSLDTMSLTLLSTLKATDRFKTMGALSSHQ